MKSIKELKATMPQIGIVKWIGVRSARKVEPTSIQKVLVDQKYGLEGDHYTKESGHRLITLIQEEDLVKVSKFLEREVHPGMTRRNIVVAKINLNALHDALFQVGGVQLEGTGFCHPCSRMEENLGEGGYNAMRGHGGITAKVIKGGTINIGDSVQLLSPGVSEV